MQKILHTKVFSVKLQSVGLHGLILTISSLVVTKDLSMYIWPFLSPGMKG